MPAHQGQHEGQAHGGNQDSAQGTVRVLTPQERRTKAIEGVIAKLQDEADRHEVVLAPKTWATIRKALLDSEAWHYPEGWPHSKAERIV